MMIASYMMSMTGGFPFMRDDRPHRNPDEPIDIKELLDATLIRLNITDDDPYVSFCRNWQGLIGSRLYPHITPIDVKNGTLIVKSDHPSWSSILQMQKKQILARINAKYPSLGIFTLQVVSR